MLLATVFPAERKLKKKMHALAHLELHIQVNNAVLFMSNFAQKHEEMGHVGSGISGFWKPACRAKALARKL